MIGQLNWPGSTAIEAVLGEIMTRYLDADVETISAAQEALYEGLDKGDGSVDIVADMWTDHLPAQMKRLCAAGRQGDDHSQRDALSRHRGHLHSDLCRGRERRHASSADLAKPEVAKLFDSDGNGKGEIWAGEVGWESTNHTAVRAKTDGFDKTMELTTVGTPVMLAQLKDAHRQAQGVSPSTTGRRNGSMRPTSSPSSKSRNSPAIRRIAAKGTDRYNADGCYTFYQPQERNDWLEASSIKCGQPPTRVNIAHSKALAERAPKVSQFLRQVKLDANDVNAWILAMEVDKKDVNEVAKAWVDANKDKIEKEWLAGTQ